MTSRQEISQMNAINNNNHEDRGEVGVAMGAALWRRPLTQCTMFCNCQSKRKSTEKNEKDRLWQVAQQETGRAVACKFSRVQKGPQQGWKAAAHRHRSQPHTGVFVLECSLKEFPHVEQVIWVPRTMGTEILPLWDTVWQVNTWWIWYMPHWTCLILVSVV